MHMTYQLHHIDSSKFGRLLWSGSRDCVDSFKELYISMFNGRTPRCRLTPCLIMTSSACKSTYLKAWSKLRCVVGASFPSQATCDNPTANTIHTPYIVNNQIMGETREVFHAFSLASQRLGGSHSTTHGIMGTSFAERPIVVLRANLWPNHQKPIVACRTFFVRRRRRNFHQFGNAREWTTAQDKSPAARIVQERGRSELF